jgi:hypothetical protein
MMLDKFSDEEILDIFRNHDLTVTKVTLYRWRKGYIIPTNEQYAYMKIFMPDNIPSVKYPVVFVPIPRA